MLAIQEEPSDSPPLSPATFGRGEPTDPSQTCDTCSITLLILVFHGGSVLDASSGSTGQSQESLTYGYLPPNTPNTASKQVVSGS